MKKSKGTILYIFNDTNAFLVGRANLIKDVVAAGFDVQIGLPEIPIICKDIFPNIVFHTFFIKRDSVNIFCEIQSIISIYKLIKSVKPEIIHNFTLKASLYGTIAGSFYGQRKIVNSFTGLGQLYTDNTKRFFLIKKMVNFIFRVFIKRKNIMNIFQNQDDISYFVQNGLCFKSNSILIKSSGIDLIRFAYQAEVEWPKPKILLIGRALYTKGLREYFSAIKILHEKGIIAEFYYVGDIDPGNPATLSRKELTTCLEENNVTHIPWTNEVEKIIANSNIVCLPSYREGMPRAVLEASAIGRAVITTDVVGCRDSIIPNKTGLLINSHSAEELAETLLTLINNPILRREFGKNGRDFVEKNFASNIINQEILATYANTDTTP